MQLYPSVFSSQNGGHFEGRFLAISVLVWMSNMLITGLQYDGDLGRPGISSSEVVSR